MTVRFLFPSSCFRYQVCGDWERLSSYERKKCSKTKQGDDPTSRFPTLVFVLLFFSSVSETRLCYLCCLQEVLELAFSVLYDPDETLNFVAPNKYEVSSWRLWAALPSTRRSWGGFDACCSGFVFLSSTASGQTGCARCWAERWAATWHAATWTHSSAWRWSSASSTWRTSPSQKPRRQFLKSLALTTSPTTTAEVCVCARVCLNEYFFCFCTFSFVMFQNLKNDLRLFLTKSKDVLIVGLSGPGEEWRQQHAQDCPYQ